MQNVEWVKCSDSNYWTDKKGYVTIVKINFGGDIGTVIYVRENCPYGWNVLVRENAEMMDIKL